MVLPPAVAPIQVIIVPVAMHKPGVIEKAEEILNTLNSVCRVQIDKSDKSPGWKFSEYEMRGVPLRLELGPRDIQNNECVIVRRDNLEKIKVSLDSLEDTVVKLLQKVHEGMYQKALERRQSMTYTAQNEQEFEKIAQEKIGLIKAPWCGSTECEETIKEKTAFTSRCIIEETPSEGSRCLCCGNKPKHVVYWAKAY